MDILTDIQKKRFLDISGIEFDFKELRRNFTTPYPYNDRSWKYSPWHFTYVIEEETGNLICELEHRMTNNRIYGWDIFGNELPNEILYKYFTPHL
ncbi:MAG: hypothetical protein FWH01_11240 [Oscillospiraceae bacterium]|nr:hypothetical protein [Oscillospiraceae bacterium]